MFKWGAVVVAEVSKQSRYRLVATRVLLL